MPHMFVAYLNKSSQILFSSILSESRGFQIINLITVL